MVSPMSAQPTPPAAPPTPPAAPDFAPGYPSKGERIGPAWDAIWRLLADGQARDRFEIERAIRDPWELSPLTVRNLLQQARKCGHLVAEIGGGRAATLYRRERSEVIS